MQARVSASVRPVWTKRSTGVMVILLAIVLLALPSLGQVQPAPAGTTTVPVAGVNEPVPAKAQVEPYVAEATGNDVFIRSGPGTNFYQCGKLYAGDRVQVINTQQGWSCIVPPPGCFSWVSMQYVSINLENPTVGIITGDNVGVYAGSDFVEPMWSTSKQAVLNRGQTVKLLGEEKDDYYKISPPQGAYLWVSSQFLQAVDRPVVKPAETNPSGVPVPVVPLVKPAGADPNIAPKTDLDIYYALAEQVSLERAKPRAEQNYAEIKTKLQELAAKKDSGRAMRYAQYTLDQVERFELVVKADKELALQKKELVKVEGKIDEARAARLAGIEDTSRFAVVGRLEASSVYDASGLGKRFRLLDESGTTICYVTPTGSAATADYSKLIGRKVGLVGRILSHEPTARATVEFTEVVPLE
ncbi:MAG TPA: SH3 domain-containing protein [Sedimentisphaerales bacterium]|nr:SH3 domain-containing protein [Sedimentisphaerales bacterium]HNU28197.1 SH3 domain-containing protein [Sedimentisphaerales bacterium]